MAQDSLFVMAGEASGDMLGAMILDGLAKHPATAGMECFGVGGAAMAVHGFESALPMDDFTIIGFAAIPRALLRLNRHAGRLIDLIMQRRPRAVITIDNKGFSLRFARRLRRRMAKAGWHAPLIHVVAPTVWAWGSWRAKAFASVFDRLLCLFPFEEKYFAGYGMEVHITGHPAAERKRPSRAAARRALGIGRDEKLLALLPGSRGAEIESLLPPMCAAYGILRGQHPALTAAIPMSAGVAGKIERMIKAKGADGVRLLPQDMLDTVLCAADYGMICSGTVTLEAALAGLPGAVYYRPDMLTRAIAGVIADRSMGVLANAVSGREIYPFLLNREFTPESMAEHARGYLMGDGGAAQARMIPDDFAKSLRTESGFAGSAANAIAGAIAE